MYLEITTAVACHVAAVKRLPVHRYGVVIFRFFWSFGTVRFSIELETENRSS